MKDVRISLFTEINEVNRRMINVTNVPGAIAQDRYDKVTRLPMDVPVFHYDRTVLEIEVFGDF